MKSLIPAVRISLGLVSLAVSILCAAQVFGVLPDATAAILNGRKALCEAVAIHCSLAVQRGDVPAVEVVTRAVVERNRDVLSAAIRRADGALLAAVGPHQARWGAVRSRQSTATHVQVPIAMGDKLWGTVEIRFAPLSSAGPLPLLGSPMLRFFLFFAGASLLAYSAYLRYLLRHVGLAPSSGIPQRVKATLDTLVEGVLLLDKDQRIALANDAFAKRVGRPAEELAGRTAMELRWNTPSSHEAVAELPWSVALRDGTRQIGTILELQSGESSRSTLSVNATPILDDAGATRGVLATFDDLTSIERKNSRLRKLLDKLKVSRAEIQRHNQQLKDLATLDPLTSCLNRRSFFERFDVLWKAAERYDHPLSCLMLDIDHFKSINDRYGHGVGDQALQQVSAVLRSMARTTDLVCRYGGEEFCVVLPHVDLEGAMLAAERFRSAIESTTFAGISATASFGVSTVQLGAEDPHGLLNQADQALYAAKRSGRNRAVRWDQMPEGLKAEAPAKAHGEPPKEVELDVPVSYHAVTSLVSALAYRDVSTAEHSRRVADLCVAAAKGLMTERECYLLEIAALLHDVGKLGVPDAVLRKPGPLTESEWKVMGTHDRMGVEIITAAFSSPQLSEIVRTHHAWFGGNPRDPELPVGEHICLGARILAIADAYDAMVSDRVYRKGMGREMAFAELRRCAGEQFDPVLAEQFIVAVLARDESRATPASSISKRTAFKIGLQIEKLADTLDSKDSGKLAAMAAKLRETAIEHEIPAIAEAASHLEEAVASRCDWLDALELTNDLLELCRSTQSSYLETCQLRGDAAKSVEFSGPHILWGRPSGDSWTPRAMSEDQLALR